MSNHAVLGKFSVILATSLAKGPPLPSNSSCRTNISKPCYDLEQNIEMDLVISPLAIATTAWAVASLPVFFMGFRSKIQGIRCCLWALLQIWAHMLMCCYLFYGQTERAQAYVWSLHASVNVLSTWRPARNVLRYEGLQRVACVLGCGALSTFAWHGGVALGLVGWSHGIQAQCGWTVHLIACLGVDAVQWLLAPIGGLVMGV